MCDPPRPPRCSPPNMGFNPMARGPAHHSPNTCYMLAPSYETRLSPETDHFSQAASPSRPPPSTSRPHSVATGSAHRRPNLGRPLLAPSPPPVAGFLLFPDISDSGPLASDPSFVSIQGVSQVPIAAQEDALEELNDLSRMVCGEHNHHSTISDLIPSGRTEGYSVQWQCGMFLWNIKICINCGFKRITCSKTVEVPNQEINAHGLPSTAPKTRLRILGVWEGIVCEYLVYLHRIDQLNIAWWKNDVDPRANDNAMGLKRPYKIWAPNHVTCHPPSLERTQK